MVESLPDMTDPRIQDAAIEQPLPTIWVTGMWGFTPEVEGYVGFTSENTRSKYLRDAAPGDLMMIVGQKGQYSDPHDVGRTLALVELDPRPIHESEAMPEDAYRRKVDRYGVERWQYAMPILRAWRINREIKSQHAAPVTCHHRNARVVGANFLRLTDAEVQTVLGLPVTPAKVWGNEEWSAQVPEKATEQRADAAVSRGPRPSFGPRSSSYEDGETVLYVFALTGCVDAVFPDQRPTATKCLVVKIGRSNSPVRREAELNSGLPPTANLRWQLRAVQRFPNADEAHDAEQALLAILEERRKTIGREFAILPERDIDSLVASVAGRSAFHIKA